MKQIKKKAIGYKKSEERMGSVREAMAVPMQIANLPDIGASIGVRSAKAHLSAVVSMVERGKNIVLMRDGKPVAKLIPYQKEHKPFKVNWKLFNSIPKQTGGPDSTELIRKDRDGRW